MAGRKLGGSKGRGGVKIHNTTTNSPAGRPVGVRKKKTTSHGARQPTTLKETIQQAPVTICDQKSPSIKTEYTTLKCHTVSKGKVSAEECSVEEAGNGSINTPCHGRADIKTGVVSKVVEQSRAQQVRDKTDYEEDIVIARKYADPYERADPANDKCFDEQRRLNLFNNLRVQGYATNNATSIAAWLMRCNGKWQPWTTRNRKGGRRTGDGRSRQRTVQKSTSKEVTPATIAEHDAEPEDGSSVHDASEVGSISKAQDREVDSQARLNPIEAALAKAQRNLGVFHKVYGEDDIDLNEALSTVYWPTHISRIPRALPRSGRFLRRSQPLVRSKIYAAQINLPCNERHNDDDELDVWTEDPLFGDSVPSSQTLSWTDRLTEKGLRQIARERNCSAVNTNDAEQKENHSEEADSGGRKETQPVPHHHLRQTMLDWEAAEIASCRTFGSTKPHEPWKALEKAVILGRSGSIAPDNNSIAGQPEIRSTCRQPETNVPRRRKRRRIGNLID